MTEKSTTQLPDVTVPTSASLPVQTPAPSLISEDAVRVATAKQPSIWDALHVPKDVQESTKAIGQIVGTVSTAVSWVGTVQSALKLAGFIKPEPNPFDTLFQRIQGELRILLAATLAGATEERLRDVAEQVAIARTAAQNANEYILLGRPKDQFHIGRMALADRDSLSVINVLAAAEWWQRSYDPTPAIIIGPAVEGPPSLVASDYWWHPPEGGVPGGSIFDLPQPSGGLIWDYRHILPAYLQSVAARIVVLRARAATTAEFLNLVGSEVPSYVAFLKELHARIKDNIKFTKPPKPHQGHIPAGVLITTGAVEISSGTHVWGGWDAYAPGTGLPRNTYDEEVQVYNRLAQDCWFRVYNAVGLNDLQVVIDNLNSLLIPPCGVVTGSNASASAAVISCMGGEPNEHVFVTGSDGGMHILWKPSREARWQWHNAGTPPGTKLQWYHRPAAISYGEGSGRRLYAFTRTDTYRLFTYYWNGAAWHWADQGKPEISVAGNPSVTTFQQYGMQHIRAYAVGTGKLGVNWWNGASWQWLDLGKAPQIAQVGSYGLQSDPAVVTYRYDGRMLDDAYVIAPGGIYEHFWYEDGSRGWTKPPMPKNIILEGTPAAVTYEKDGRPIVYVFTTDMLGNLHSLEWDSSWRWTEHGAPSGTKIKTAVSAHSVKAAVLRYFDVLNQAIAVVVGKNGRLYARMQNSSGWDWFDLRTPPNSTTRDVLGLTSYVKNGGYLGLDIFVRGENNHIYRTGISFDNTWDDLGVR